MRFEILISAPYFLPVVTEFEPVFQKYGMRLITPIVKERLTEADLMPLVDTLDGAICGDDAFTEAVLRKAMKLKVISKWGTGTDSIDKEAAKRRGIKVLNTPDAFSQPVADSVLGYVICFARRLVTMDREMRKAEWKKSLAPSLSECTLGVIGIGNVGKQVVRRAKAFGMTVLGNDIIEIPEEFVRETGVELVTKDEIYARCDFISINCDLNRTSYHLIGERQLGQMKSSAYVINTARGPIVDETALVGALQAGQIAGAALDVFEVEPLPLESALLSMDNVMLAPHNANSSPKAWQFVHRNTILNLCRGLGIEDAEHSLEVVG